MNEADQQQLTSFWHRGTCRLNEQVDEAFKLAQDQAYELGLKRGQATAGAAVVEVGLLKQSLWPMKDQEMARWKDAYENLRDYAVKSGLDITCYLGPK